jgi:two-component system cell cycle sensor histidine kinase/response regulator CckA
VLINLIVNARDAMPGGGHLRIGITREKVDAIRAEDLEMPPGTYVAVSVSDSGEGINKDTLEYIFEPFFTTKAPGQGTGLGLSTVFGIVRQSGGVIEVDSEVTKGTTFRVYFPLSAEGAVAARHRPVSVATGARPSTILLAEDEQGVRTFLEMALTRAGHRVIASRTGPDAVLAGETATEPIDLLIADVVMPGLSGPEVAEQLRRSHPEMRTLFLSGYASHASLPERVTAEPASVLQKPFTVETLMLKVRDRLAQP